MGDFDEFAAGMNRDHQAKQQAHDEKMRKESAEREALMQAGRAYLEDKVIPILSEAAEAYGKLGLRTEIKPNWRDADLHMRPNVSFQVFGQKKRPFDDSTYEVAGNLASVWHDGEGLTASISDNSYSQVRGKDFEGHDLNAVREVSKRALSTLYAALDPSS